MQRVAKTGNGNDTMAATAESIVATPSSATRSTRIAAIWRNPVGKKALMAVTGIVLFLFTVVHMAGNLQVFKGAEALDHYAELLRTSMPFLWFTRLVLLTAALVHAIAGIQLWLARQSARPVGYQDYRPVISSAASRTMIWSGLLILLFVVFHLLDLTVGVVHPQFQEGRVFQNLIVSLSVAWGTIIYVIAMIALGFHLWHGLWSTFQSLGLAHRGISVGIQKFAIGAAVILTLGFAAVPLAVISGLVR
jgi:succinate dehydrogenase / fumarate reductase cytochrome b subunit